MSNVFADLALDSPAQLRARAAICARLRSEWIAPDQASLPELLARLRAADGRFDDPCLDREADEDPEDYGDRLYAAILSIRAVTPQEFVRDNSVSDEASELLDSIIREGRGRA